ncbi:MULTISPECIES: amidase [unclassified Mesorhizobium]|uniref:amidase n=1 Tax=unclassified Mesorhizobium TaxID=325217 RepID=UPI0021E258AA|nr:MULTISPECIES: amidase [unclassified Mesorhizobium]
MSSEIWCMSADEQSKQIAQGQLSSREIVDAVLARIWEVNPETNALVEILAEEALAAADKADAELRQGKALGRLHGVPITIKVNTDQKGCASTNGVVAFRDAISNEDSTVVSNFRKSGAIIVGRTNTPAFSHRWFTDNELHGPTINPRNKALTPGGSSGGAAAAVAAGMGAIAQGNDFGGSIRYPAYACGVMGLRPTTGRIPRFNPSRKAEAPITAQLMAVEGPIARSVADLRLALSAMEQRDPRDPNWIKAAIHVTEGSRSRCVAISPNPFEMTDPIISSAIRRAGYWLERAGYDVEEVDAPGLYEASELWHSLVINEERRFLVPSIEQFGDHASKVSISDHMRYAPRLNGDEILQCFERRIAVMRNLQQFMEKFPTIILPVSDKMPFANGADLLGFEAFKEIADAQRPLLAIPPLGLPSLAVPLGDYEGTPLGIQIVSTKFHEGNCFKIAEVLEAHAPVTVSTLRRQP